MEPLQVPPPMLVIEVEVALQDDLAELLFIIFKPKLVFEKTLFDHPGIEHGGQAVGRQIRINDPEDALFVAVLEDLFENAVVIVDEFEDPLELGSTEWGRFLI